MGAKNTVSNVNKNDILAIIQANRQLGEDYDKQSADQIYELIEERHKPPEITPEDVIRILGQLPASERRRFLRPFLRHKHSSVSSVMALSIPLMAVAGGFAGIRGVVAVLVFAAVAIVLGMVR